VKSLLIITSAGGGGHLQAAENIKNRPEYRDFNVHIIKVLSEDDPTPITIGSYDLGQQGVARWNSEQKNQGGMLQSITQSSFVISLTNQLFSQKAEAIIQTALLKIIQATGPNNITVIDCQPLFTSSFITTLKSVGIYNYTKVLTDAPSQDAIHFNAGIREITPPAPGEHMHITIEMLKSPRPDQTNEEMAKTLYPNLYPGGSRPPNIHCTFSNGPVKQPLAPSLFNDIPTTYPANRYVIMLGSQAGQETQDFVAEIINKHNRDKTYASITAFCGSNEALFKTLHAIGNPQFCALEVKSVVPNHNVLNAYNQATHIIIRAGGLAIMETMPYLTNPHLEKLSILNHFSVPWEKGNADYLQATSEKVQIVSPETLFAPTKNRHVFAQFMLGLCISMCIGGALYLHFTGILPLISTIFASAALSLLLLITLAHQSQDNLGNIPSIPPALPNESTKFTTPRTPHLNPPPRIQPRQWLPRNIRST
jgi:hypothetical protein